MLKIYIYILLFFTLFIFYLVNTLIAEPYMDEIFHFPQADKYLNGIYDESSNLWKVILFSSSDLSEALQIGSTSWDSKITTPPGLYIFTVAILKPLSQVANVDVSKVACFRLVNLNFTVWTMYVIYRILQHLHKEEAEKVLLLSSFNIAMFPVLYFFNFLYYTDCGSTFFVLLMYYWHLKKFHFSSAVAGAVSLLFRQTNIVWIFCAAADETLCALLDSCSEGLSKKDEKLYLTSVSDFKKTFLPLWVKNWKSVLKKIIQINSGYILVAAGFVAFVASNGSLALGDKAAHQACIHTPQLFYFLLFFFVFASPYLLSFSKVKKFISFVSNNKVFMFELFIVCGFCILFMSHVHPYLIADNRHFTFYIWRRILGRNVLLSLALIPVYIFCGWSTVNALQHEDIIFKIITAFCVVVSVVPQKLLEFRYFIIPFIMLRIHLRVKSKWQPYLEFVLFSVINFLVLYLFLFQMLPWDSAEKAVRIMW